MAEVDEEMGGMGRGGGVLENRVKTLYFNRKTSLGSLRSLQSGVTSSVNFMFVKNEYKSIEFIRKQ